MKTFKDTPKESVKLKTLVNNLRQCKTMEDERTLITRECADIRATMVNPQFRTRNVMKLIYLHLLGYPTQFAQIECLALISSYNFQAKRIGYLALGLLMDETDETLTLVINQLQKDLQSNVQCVTELALTTIANIASEELCQVLSPLVIKTISAPHHNVKKKAVAAAIRIIIKCPYLAKEYVNPLNSLLANKSERFILSSTKLALVMINTNDILQQCQESSEHLLAVLKQNSRGTSSDVTLQGLITCHILELLQKLISKKYMIQLEDIIVDILINSPKNSIGVSVGLSAVRCAIEIDCDPIIKQMAINYLMQLLHSQFSNDRYASLRYLNEIISKCWKLVLPYKTRCIECLNDSDIGIRMLSLQLCYEFAQHGLQKEMVRDIVHYLGNDPEFTQAATRIVCDIISDVDASDVWKFEYLLQLALASGDDVGDDITQRIISVIASSSIQTYAVTKLFPLLLDTPMAVQKASIWVIGEYFDFLTHVMSSHDVIDHLFVCKSNKELVLFTLSKIVSNTSQDERDYVLNKLKNWCYGNSIELNQRYYELIDLCTQQQNNVLSRMPICDNTIIFSTGSSNKEMKLTVEKSDIIDDNSIFDQKVTSPDLLQDISPQKPQSTNNITNSSQQKPSTASLFDFDISNDPKSNTQPSENTKQSTSLLDDILGISSPQLSQPKSPSKYDFLTSLNETYSEKQSSDQSEHQSSKEMFDFLGKSQMSPEKPQSTNDIIEDQTQQDMDDDDEFEFTEYTPQQPLEKRIDVVKDDNISISFKIKPNNDGYYVNVLFSNTTSTELTNMILRVAAQKGIQITIEPPTNDILQPNIIDESIQSFTTNGNLNGNVNVRIKLSYNYKGETKTIQSGTITLNK